MTMRNNLLTVYLASEVNGRLVYAFCFIKLIISIIEILLKYASRHERTLHTFIKLVYIHG